MELQKGSKLVRWTYVLDGKGLYPSQISLCRFFWRAFLWMPLFWLLVISLVAGFIWALGMLSWLSYGVFPVFVLVVFLLSYFSYSVQGVSQRIWSRAEQTVFIQGLKTVKGKICPLIEIK